MQHISLRSLLLAGASYPWPASPAHRRRRHLRAAAQSAGAAELADGPSRLRCAAVLAARADQQGRTSRTSSSVRGRDRRHLGNEVARGDAAGRGRLHVHRRPLGRRLQDRRALGQSRHASCGRWIPARKSSTAIAASRCGAISSSRSPRYDGRVIATDKETGKIVWDKNLHDQPDLELTAAPLALKDSIDRRRLRRRPRRARLDRGARRQDRRREVEDLLDPRPRRARQRDLEGQEQRLADRRRRVLRHRLLRPRDQPHLLGLRQPGARLRRRPTGRATISTPPARSPSTPRPARSLAFPVHAERQPRLRRDRHPHPHRHQGERRGSQDRHPCRAATASTTCSTATAASSSRRCPTPR